MSFSNPAPPHLSPPPCSFNTCLNESYNGLRATYLPKNTVFHRRARQRANFALLQVLSGPGRGLEILLKRLGCEVVPQLGALIDSIEKTKSRRSELRRSQEGRKTEGLRKRRQRERAEDQKAYQKRHNPDAGYSSGRPLDIVMPVLAASSSTAGGKSQTTRRPRRTQQQLLSEWNAGNRKGLFQCEHCQRVYASKQGLLGHVKSHAGDDSA